MFKENKEFWLYIVGIIFLMILTYFVMVSYQFPFVGYLTGKEAEKSYEYKRPPEIKINKKKDYRARIFTNKGRITIDLYEKAAPETVNNFVFLSNEGYYDRVGFHRVIRDFLVQTGSRTTLDDDPDNDPLGDPGYFFDDEINWNSLGLSSTKKAELKAEGFSNDTQIKSHRLERYSVAMANAGPDTNGSQFFIITAGSNDNRLKDLQGRHTVFGTVVSGFDVLEKINNAPLEESGNDAVSRPIGDFYIRYVEIVAV